MKLKGIIKGQSIELLEPIAIAEGSEVTIEISESELETLPDWTELQKVIGVWQEDTEIQEIFAEIDRERHLDLGREVDFDTL
ncbi:MAG: hypothetical protein QNJ34_23920 [Xenococcaceae cyanobacterium MO_188.B29]|nr:hypothetical protein [Xenococcaceae cyanobacterium MO_188.B29]